MIGYLMRSRSRRIAVLLASALLAGPARPISAWADPRSGSAKDQKMASDLVKKAIAKSEAGDHAGAIKLYNEAYLLAPNSLLLSNIGAQYQELGQWEDALEYFCRYLKEDPSGTNAPYARSQARIMQRQLGRKKIDSRDPCAAPADDGAPDDRSKGPDDGGQGTGGKGQGTGGKGQGTGGKGQGTGGKGQGTGDKGQGTGDKGQGTGGEGGPIDDSPALPAKPTNGNSALMYTGLAAGIAGIAAGGLGIYYGVQGKSISDLVNNHPVGTPWPDDIRAKMAEGERDNRRQVGFLVASGVLVATGVVLYVVGRPDAAPEHASDKTAIRVAPTANGFAVFGRF
jgi:tetratricopeptide (TPR) repeat protein